MENELLLTTDEDYIDTAIQIMARGMVHSLYRNGIVQSLHEQCAVLDSDTVDKLFDDLYKRMYTILYEYLNSDQKETLLKWFNYGTVVERDAGKAKYLPELIKEMMTTSSDVDRMREIERRLAQKLSE
ncbi:MAG: hypothetical protein K6C13_04730 [Oscillospiraceae bacterium]|nr:hypothetical protein [Oscillospiraceae bacterium]